MMKCDEAQARLIESLYGEFRQDEEGTLRAHLAGCDSCRRQMEALRESRQRLDELAGPELRLDPGRVYRAAAARSERGRRRWRRMAIAASAAAVLIAAFAATRLDVEWRPGQVTVFWNGSLRASEAPVPTASDPSPPPWSRYEGRIETLEEVARLLSAELTRDDARHAAVVTELGRFARWQRDIEAFARRSDQRSQRAEKDIQDLLVAWSSPELNDKGGIP